MVCVKAITVRFHLNHPAEKQAWEKLNALRREQRQSFSQLVTDVVNAYGAEGISLSHDDKNEIVHDVTESVSLRLQHILPAFLAGYSAGTNAPVAAAAAPMTSAPIQSPAIPHKQEPNDAVPDFGDSCMDFDFIGG